MPSLSSSSSSSISSSSSSYSSEFCQFLDCSGDACQYFSNWSLQNVRYSLTDNGKFYCAFTTFGNIQQIRVYNDSLMNNMVASCEGLSSPLIFVSANDSGITGSVDWDETLIDFPFSTLSCLQYDTSNSSSKSSSSSSTSGDSNSSSKSSSSSSSSNSSSSSSSISSTSQSTVSQSSSSSIDSHSSSSTSSVLNTSMSSSSSGGVWNRIKPLCLANVAINSPSSSNRLSQTITLTSPQYSIGEVYCYFYQPKGARRDYSVVLEIRECNNDGTPLTFIATKSINASTILSDGWYGFSFDINGITPANKLLSFVMWNDGADENNYILWAYGFNDQYLTSTAWTSYNGIIWEEQKNTIRGIKVTGNFNPYNLDNNEIVTPPADEVTITSDINDPDPIFDGTIIDDLGNVVIDYSNIIASFVVDSSGSMGWNDRFDNRSEIINKIIDKINTSFPSNKLFDIVKFGSTEVNMDSITADIGQAITVNLDLSSPDRAPYFFTVNSASASIGSVYTNNGYSFTVQKSLSSETQLFCTGTGLPLTTGTLTLESGIGDATIIFTSYRTITISGEKIIAYGFKTFEGSHIYNVGSLKVDGSEIDEVSLVNWDLFKSFIDISTLSIGVNGPKETSSVDIYTSNLLTARKDLYNKELLSSKIITSLIYGDTTVKVDDVSIFSVGIYVDIIGGSVANIYRTITAIDTTTSTLTFTPSIEYGIDNFNTYGGIVQISNYANSLSISGTTANILVRDILTTENIVFFLQTVSGLSLEWDFSPFNEWIISNLYWLDETAALPISIFDKDGTPFPDGTKIELTVDDPPQVLTDTELESKYLLLDALSGSVQIYLVSTSGFLRNDVIDIADKLGNIQTTTIIEIGTDVTGDYIVILDNLQFSLLIINDGRVSLNSSTSSVSLNNSTSNVLSSFLSLVDITPIYTGIDSTPFLQPYDLTAVPVSTAYDDLNFAKQYIQNQIKDTASVDGNSVIRVLPITEDNLKTVKEKNSEVNRILRLRPETTLPSQLEQNSGDFGHTTSSTGTGTFVGPDYTLQTPIYLINGYAKSSMTCFAKDFSDISIPGVNIPGVPENTAIKAKLYSIYPLMKIESDNGTTLAAQYFEPFDVYFVPSMFIYSETDGKEVKYYVEQTSGDECKVFSGYSQVSLPGVYASGSDISMNYVITEKFSLKKSGTLHIRLYSNKIVDLDTFASSNPETSNSYLSVPNQNGTPNSYDQWRTEVVNNPIANVLLDPSVNPVVAGNSDPESRTQESMIEYAKLVGGTTSSSTISSSSLFYQNSYQWTVASQYSSYEFDIPIINGKASFNIPSNDTVCLLFVEASYKFGANLDYESIAADFIFVANPIDVSGFNPTTISPTEGEKYEVGTNITWKDNVDGIIDDNTVVNYTFPVTHSTPSSSATDNGWAGGVVVGPRNPIIYPPASNTKDVICPPVGEIESVVIEVFHSSGYTKKVSRKILWTGKEQQAEDLGRRFYFYATSTSNSGWSDGSEYPATIVTSNLDDGVNESPSWVGEDGIARLKGLGQKDNLPRMVYASPTTPSKLSWDNGIVEFISVGLNQNIGHAQPYDPKDKPPSPWYRTIDMSTGYLDADNKWWFGEVANGNPYPNTDGSMIVPKPLVLFTEPLNVTVSLEASSFLRDGVHSPTIVADVTWKGQFIKDTFTYNAGTLYETTVPFSFPNVRFESGTCSESNATGKTIVKMVDPRNISGGCYKIAANKNAKLTNYYVTVGLFRTDIVDLSGNEHTHACSVDTNGNGNTTSTIVINGAFSDHSHIITNYYSDEILSHSHSLRSVAITSIKPTSDTMTNIAINAYAYYNPTSVGGDQNPENRMMFATLYLDGAIPPGPPGTSKLTLSMTAGSNLSASNPFSSEVPTFYTAKDPGETAKGFDIRAYAEYNDIPVPSGTRITFEIIPFKDGDSSDTVISAPGTKRPYMTLKIRASISYNDLSVSEELTVAIVSINQWIPQIKSLLPELTDDTLYISEAISKINSYGASQINDAVIMATNRIIQAQTDDILLKKYKKIIFLLTDGDENTSQYSVAQAINSVNFIDGIKEVQVLPIKLGKTYGSDEILLKKYAEETSGFINPVFNYSSAEIDNVVSNIISNPILSINQGIYGNTFVFDTQTMADSITITSVDMPVGSTIDYRTSASVDGITWLPWTEWTDYSSSINFADIYSVSENQNKYIKYELKFYGTDQFTSPKLTNGVQLKYLKPQGFVTFFQPINVTVSEDEYISSIHITHEADIPETSSVIYGYTQSDSINPDDYYEVVPDQHFIIPSRYNESLITNDYKLYSAVNGRWNQGSDIQIYRYNDSLENGLLIDNTLYSINASEGTITFINQQSITDTFLLCLNFTNSFRLFCKTINLGSSASVIHYIGAKYNVTKRVPRDNSGNIIHKPLNKIII